LVAARLRAGSILLLFQFFQKGNRMEEKFDSPSSVLSRLCSQFQDLTGSPTRVVGTELAWPLSDSSLQRFFGGADIRLDQAVDVIEQLSKKVGVEPVETLFYCIWPKRRPHRVLSVIEAGRVWQM